MSGPPFHSEARLRSKLQTPLAYKRVENRTRSVLDQILSKTCSYVDVLAQSLVSNQPYEEYELPFPAISVLKDQIKGSRKNCA